LKVLEEIDNNKKRQDGAGTNARMVIRNLDALREKGSLSKGVRIDKGKGLICVKMVKKEGLPEDLDLSVPDNEIISVALNQQAEHPKRKVIVVTRDINMRVKCDSLGLTTEDFQSDQAVKNTDNIFTGFTTHLVDEPVLDMFYAGEEVKIKSK
jgi:PhoH-like ATPase